MAQGQLLGINAPPSQLRLLNYLENDAPADEFHHGIELLDFGVLRSYMRRGRASLLSQRALGEKRHLSIITLLY
ncbi:MAG: hypothetical protein CM15mP120_23030 [Pseudomonadota bacterium]|nr:MAG: hypothetical protein CM15mP120_23030 [Pseudomonadota bacterium]